MVESEGMCLGNFFLIIKFLYMSFVIIIYIFYICVCFHHPTYPFVQSKTEVIGVTVVYLYVSEEN